jgi:hypothetical protein
MKITTVSYKRSSTLNVGDYESVRIEVGAVAEVEDEDDAEDVFEALRQQVGEELRQDALDVRRKVRAREQRD